MFSGKKLSIMQPYFFPYLGYFSLMHYADALILFDIVEYDRKGWMNRNRIQKPDSQDWQYIRAGVEKPSYKALIKDVRLVHNEGWKNRIIRQLEHYRSTSPHYEKVLELVESILSIPSMTITELNRNALVHIRDYLGIECPLSVFSEMSIELQEIEHPGQWALYICEALKAKEYVNPIGGKGLFRLGEFAERAIQLEFIRNRLTPYPQPGDDFIEGLSIIDVLMYNTREQALGLIEDYEITSH
ncbi:MAG: WbqC family protein [Sphaerochaetaceae bacterium]|nr:WbqC family protein [Sphaerochaetaceae bacterium]